MTIIEAYLKAEKGDLLKSKASFDGFEKDDLDYCLEKRGNSQVSITFNQVMADDWIIISKNQREK